MSAARRHAGGFILVTTLWALVALAVLAAYIDGVVASDIERAVEAKRSLRAELERRNTEATLIYLLVTGRMNHLGLILEDEQRFADFLAESEPLPARGDGELRVTGEVYAGLGAARFSILDEGALISVNSPHSRRFAALLEHMGVSASNAAQIAARVEDYIDTDDALSLNGAERHDYWQEGKPPPLNWIMTSPLELKKVLGLDELITPAQWRRLRPLLTMRPAFGYNFNTMKPEVLAALLGLDERAIRKVLEVREVRSISRLNQIAALSGKHLDIDSTELKMFPSHFLRIAIWHEGEGSRSLTGVALTPFGDSAPWRKDYRYAELMPTGDGSITPRESPLDVATALFH